MAKKDIETKLSAARTRLILEKPFLGALVLRMPLIAADPDWCPTTATDARSIYFNPEYIASLTPAETEFVLSHEALHCALSHFARRQHRVKRHWDVACVPGGTLIPGDYEAIDRIGTGTMAFGFSGRVVRVTQTFTRHFEGQMIRIQAAHLPPLTVTPEHPLLVVARPGRGISRSSAGAPQWLRAQDLRPRHRLVVPKLQATSAPDLLDLRPFAGPAALLAVGQGPAPASLPLTPETAWLMGVYVASGMVPPGRGLVFTVDRACQEDLLQRLRPWSEDRFGATLEVHTLPSVPAQVRLEVSHPVLSRAFAAWFGASGPSKTLPDWLLTHEERGILQAFLAGYLAGTARENDPGAGGRLCLETESERLALQLQLLLARFAGLLTWQVLPAEAEVPPGPPRVYRLRSRDPQILAFLGLASPPASPRSRLALDAGAWWLVPIRKVTREPYCGPVYNLATEDHSYLVANAVVHNCDYAINPLLVNDGLAPPPNTLFEESFQGMTAEEIYPYIDENHAEEPLDRHVYDQEPQGGSGAGGMAKRPPPQEGDREAQGSEAPGEEAQGQGSQQGEREPPPRAGGAPQPPPLSEGERESLRIQWQQRMASAAQQALQAGKLGGDMARLVDHLLQPQLPWRMLLARYMTVSGRDDFSYTRPSRREGAAILPSLRSAQIEVVVALDTSGSIGDEELSQFLAEVDALKGQLRARVTVLACDAALAEDGPWVFDPWEECRLPRTLQGGGGTSFLPVFQWVARQDRLPDLLLYFTDAEGEFPPSAPPYPVLWLVKGKHPVPWGQRIQLN